VRNNDTNRYVIDAVVVQNGTHGSKIWRNMQTSLETHGSITGNVFLRWWKEDQRGHVG
jgi:hypothetical protein